MVATGAAVCRFTGAKSAAKRFASTGAVFRKGGIASALRTFLAFIVKLTQTEQFQAVLMNSGIPGFSDLVETM